MWVAIDDRAPHHKKLRRAGPEAAWLWLSGLCHCNGFSTDGRIEKEDVPILYLGKWQVDPRSLALVLVQVGLWLDRGDHFEVHDYEHFQEEALKHNVEFRKKEARERKRAQRERDRERKRREREQSRETTDPVTRTVTVDGPEGHARDAPPDSAEGQPVTAGAGQDLSAAHDTPVTAPRSGPTRSVPARPEPSPVAAAAAATASDSEWLELVGDEGAALLRAIESHEVFRPLVRKRHFVEQCLTYMANAGTTLAQQVAAIGRAAEAVQCEEAANGHPHDPTVIGKVLTHRTKTAHTWERQQRARGAARGDDGPPAGPAYVAFEREPEMAAEERAAALRAAQSLRVGGDG